MVLCSIIQYLSASSIPLETDTSPVIHLLSADLPCLCYILGTWLIVMVMTMTVFYYSCPAAALCPHVVDYHDYIHVLSLVSHEP